MYISMKQFDDMMYVKAVRKADREREIAMHGKQISTFSYKSS